MKYLLAALLISSGALIPKSAQGYIDSKEENWNHFSKKINKFKKLIENSIWIVPPPNLLAPSNVDITNISSLNQTVWLIDKFENGYFFGDAFVSINQNNLSHLNLIGSLTSLGDVYITFYPTTGEFKPVDVLTGIGKFEKNSGQFVFVMQVDNAENETSELLHRSFMISVKKGDHFYKNLPGENRSVPEFLSQFAKE